MTTCTYNSVGLSVKDRLTITNLLDLFQARLNAKWVQVNPADSKTSNVVLIDMDQPDALKRWEDAGGAGTRLAVTSNEHAAGPFLSRPIRAFGPNGLVVLLNSIGQSPAPASPQRAAEPQREPSRLRMTGRLEASIPAARPIRPQPSVAAPYETSRETTRTIPSVTPSVPEPPARVRVAVRWGPPEPVTLPHLTRMPGARIHRLEGWSEPDVFVPPPAAPAPAPVAAPQPIVDEAKLAAPPARFWHAPEISIPAVLGSMPIAHRPVEIHTPSAPIIGRSRIEPRTPPTLPQPAPIADDAPVLRLAPPQWRAPEPEAVKELLDFRSPVEALPVVSDVAPQNEEAIEETPIAIKPDEEPAEAENEQETIPSYGDAALPVMQLLTELETEAQAPDVDQNAAHQDIESLSRALEGESAASDVPADAEADWWGSLDLEPDATTGPEAEGEEASLLGALKSIKGSGQPSILEIAGLPAVCIIPGRNVYFTTAPAARIELAASTHAEMSWRACSSESEARQLSGTEDSRQASLEQLFWTASLLAAPSDPWTLADQAVRLRRWPPITESRGRSKYLRYATLLSGAQATPRELAEITGDTVEEIVGFVSACSKMNLLEVFASSKAPSAPKPAATAGAGILRDMIERLTPPKL